MKKSVLLVLMLVFSIFVFSQNKLAKLPYSFTHKIQSSLSSEIVEPLDLRAVSTEDSMRQQNGELPLIGRTIPIDYSIDDSGNWERVINGKIWRLEIESPGAQALMLYYNDFHIPYGASLFIYSKDKTSVVGPITVENNPISKTFATELVKGDDIILEYFQPNNVIELPILNINGLGYIYRDSNFKNSYKGFGDSESCQVNVNCSPEGDNWQDQKRGVVRILLTVGGSQGWCSGSMINNVAQDCTPYTLTADHCGHDATTTELTQWIFYFNYEAPSCTNPASEGSLNSQTITGCTKVANGGNSGSTGSDFYLVELSQSVPDTYNPFYNGWDHGATAATSGVGIHHPSGDIKKISTYGTTLVTSDWNGSGVNSHWKVYWDATTNGNGVTEGGSSGSPIFNQDGRIVGDLTGGGSACSALTSPDYYGKFVWSWDQNGSTDQEKLQPWLDPANSTQFIDGRNSCSLLTADFTANVTSINVGGTVTFTDASSGPNTITSWSWDFGGTGANPLTQNTQGPHNVQYTAAGLYTVSLTVGDGTSTDTETKTQYIEVLDTAIHADFTESALNINVGSSVSFTDASTGPNPITTWDWSFSGGTPNTKNTQGPHSIVYNTAGDFDVSLTVGDGTHTDTETRIQRIHVVDPNALTADFIANQTTIVQGATVDFTDMSINGPVTSWSWTFNGAVTTTSTVQNPAAIQYNNVGTFDVALTVSDGTSNDTETKIGYINVLDSNNLPVADFIADFTVIPAGTSINFTNLSTGTIDSSQWTFTGAATTSSTAFSPSAITYNNIGDFPVTLEVYNVVGGDTLTKIAYIHVIDPASYDVLNCDFHAISSRLIVAGSSVNFEDLTTGFPSNWNWEFDGAVTPTSTTQNPQGIVYNTPGLYKVKLSVYNSLYSDSLSKTQYIVVTDYPWADPNGFCDTITNITNYEYTVYPRHLSSGHWGYFPGHNSYTVKAYADKYVNYTFSNISEMQVPVASIYKASSSARVKFTIWDKDSLTGMPGVELATKDVDISSFTPYLYHSVHFSPAPDINGEFFAGFQIYYTSPMDTFSIYMSQNRGAGGHNTIYAKKSTTWYTPSQLLGDTLNASLAIKLVGCLVDVEEMEINKSLKLYPNPTSNYVNIEISDDVFLNNYDIKLYDITGKQYNVDIINSYGNKFEVNVGSLPSGIYIFNIMFNNSVITKKVSIIR